MYLILLSHSTFLSITNISSTISQQSTLLTSRPCPALPPLLTPSHLSYPSKTTYTRIIHSKSLLKSLQLLDLSIISIPLMRSLKTIALRQIQQHRVLTVEQRSDFRRCSFSSKIYDQHGNKLAQAGPTSAELLAARIPLQVLLSSTQSEHYAFVPVSDSIITIVCTLSFAWPLKTTS